jgi:hypothetical protein
MVTLEQFRYIPTARYAAIRLLRFPLRQAWYGGYFW